MVSCLRIKEALRLWNKEQEVCCAVCDGFVQNRRMQFARRRTTRRVWRTNKMQSKQRFADERASQL